MPSPFDDLQFTPEQAALPVTWAAMAQTLDAVCREVKAAIRKQAATQGELVELLQQQVDHLEKRLAELEARR